MLDIIADALRFKDLYHYIPKYTPKYWDSLYILIPLFIVLVCLCKCKSSHYIVCQRRNSIFQADITKMVNSRIEEKLYIWNVVNEYAKAGGETNMLSVDHKLYNDNTMIPFLLCMCVFFSAMLITGDML